MINKRKHYISIIGFILLSALFFYFRLRELDHLLVWDEAWNILSLRDYLSGAKENPFYWYYFFHPPLYMFFAKYLFPFMDNFAIRAASLSLFFSYITFSIVYIFAKRLGGLKYSWASCFFLSTLPAAIGYDTWIKRDSLAICLGYAALLSIYKRKFIPAAFLLGLSLLSKESALFFILSGFGLVVLSKERHKIKIILLSSIVIILLNFWWYFNLSNFSGNLFSYYLSQNTATSIVLSSNILYYFKKLLIDCGIINLFFLLTGLIYSLYLVFIKNQKRWIYPLSILGCVYLILSFVITSKAPWQTVPAIPAIAMVCATGLLFLIRLAKKKKLFKTIIFLLLFLSFFSGFNYSYEVFNSTSYPNGWPGANVSRNLASYLNRNMGPDDSLLISDFSYWNETTCPIFLYYWQGEELTILQEKDLDNTEFIEESIKQLGISWLVIPFSPDKDTKRHDAARDISKQLNKEPLRLGWTYIWDLR